MIRQSVFVSIGLLVIISGLTQAKAISELVAQDQERIKATPDTPLNEKYLTCSYIGDPHLLPFSQPYTQYWCKKEGWELLLSNQYVSLYVLVKSVSTYQIHDYMLIFPEPTACTTGSSSNPLPCQGSNSPVISQQVGNSVTHFHQTQDLIIKIDKAGNYHNIYIWQSPKLVQESCGVCINWNCPPEGLWMTPNPTVPKLCDVFIDAARAHAVGTIDERIIEIARTQCTNDVQSTFNLQAGQPALTLVLQHGIKDLLNNNKEGQTVFEKVESSKQEAIKVAQTKCNEILANSEPICKDKRTCLTAQDSLTAAEVAI